MRKGITLLTLTLILGGTAGFGQQPRQSGFGQSTARSKGFQEFRRKAMSNFQSFRQKILEHYADFLDGEWHEFEGIIEESPYTEPKPQTMPEVEARLDTAAVTNMMAICLPSVTDGGRSLAGFSTPIPAHGVDLNTGFKATKIDVPESMEQASAPNINVEGLGKMKFTPRDAEGKTNYELSALRIPDPDFAFGPFPGQLKAPRPGDSGLGEPASEQTTGDKFKFDFYGMEAFMPEIDFQIAESITGPEQTGENWRKMDAQKGGVETARQLFGLAQQLGLNGYLTYKLTESYLHDKYPASDLNARTTAAHYLMSNMGYDVRLARIGDVFTVLMPFDQKMVWGLLTHSYDGRRYSMILPEGKALPKSANGSYTFTTCLMPNDAKGKTSDLRLTGLNLPMKAKPFEISRNGITIKGTVNENIRQLLHHYPQMAMGDFATSWIDKDLRDDIIAQIKGQVADMTETQAINTLMSLCHYGFNYATDQDNHGFEKPYFFEENFIYDKNDCEDRAIFFSYLVWNALGLPCQLIQYPGHESVTIAATSPIQGCYYDNGGVKYYSSDPTYRGSRIGEVMPTFKSASPVVDQHYR